MSQLLILTGTEASGKTTIADKLVARGSGFNVVAVTTRSPRADDRGRYVYVTEKEFARHRARHELLTDTDYREHHYGILKNSLEAAVRTGKTPILSLTPSSFKAFQEEHASDHRVISIFVDAEDSVLDERLRQRGTAINSARREQDRSHRTDATYLLRTDQPVPGVVDAVETLLANQAKSGILPRQLISRLVQGGLLLQDTEEANIQAASYDLRLGDEYYYGGRIRRLSTSDPVLTIEPYDSAIVTSRERARMPRDIAGRFDLSVGLFSQGVILSNGPQIDPGFEGNLFCLLLNTSSSPVLLRRGQHYATLEFSKLMEASDSPYKGARQGKESILDYLPTNAARGAINELKRELEQMRKEGARLQTFFIAALSLMFAVSALFMATR